MTNKQNISQVFSIQCSLFTVMQQLNVALKKSTNQSSPTLGRQNLSSAAVDGCKDSHFSKSCCTKTQEEFQPWWSVNLKAKLKVTAVTIIASRGSSEMLYGAEVLIGDNALAESSL